MLPITIPILILIFCVLPQSICAADITGKEIDVYLGTGYNRSFGWCGEMSVVGAMKPQKAVTLRDGLSIGNLSGDEVSVRAFSGACVAPFSGVPPLRFSLSYIYNGLPRYGVHTQSILPVVSYNAARAGVSYGPCFRFTSFFGEPAQFEPINSFSAYFNFINDEKRRLGAVVGNFSDFCAKNAGAYSLRLNYAVSVTGNWTAVNEIELLQSGSDALSANFYGAAWRGGAKYSW